jgi:hypothetical protein
MKTEEKHIDALRVLRINGDKLFERVRGDLERGLVKEAREHLRFVDEMIEIRINVTYC